MSLLSAYDDFVRGTLAALPTTVGRLRYLAELRAENGRYDHWGMTRTYGDHAAQQAMMRAHAGVVLELLRLPVREVMRQVREEAGRRNVSPAEYFAGLNALDAALVPEKLGGGSARHFSALLMAVSKLARKATGASLPAA